MTAEFLTLTEFLPPPANLAALCAICASLKPPKHPKNGTERLKENFRQGSHDAEGHEPPISHSKVLGLADRQASGRAADKQIDNTH